MTETGMTLLSHADGIHIARINSDQVGEETFEPCGIK